ncbi:MAG: hypothetical protein IPP71_21815 [Bacteroidetes bacterium]|nr:hypothetical protein [Bacteroidota bacterium]
MKKLFRNSVVFFILLLLITIIFDFFLSLNLKKAKGIIADEFSVWNAIYDGTINSELLIYGSSRAWVQIDPQILESTLKKRTYNLGVDGHNFWISYLRHLELLKYNKKPSYVIVSLDIFTLEKRIDLYNPEQFLPYMLFNENMKHYTQSYHGFNLLDYYLPLLRYTGNSSIVFQAIKSSVKSDAVTSGRKHGYIGMNKVWNEDLTAAQTKMNAYVPKIDSSAVKLFEQFIQECSQNKIKLIFVYTPEYIDGQRFTKNRDEVMAWFEHFSKKYQIPYLNYSDDIMCQQKEYFFNSEHLNKTGSAIFSKKLGEELLKINGLAIVN